MPFSNQKRYIISLFSSGYCANPACRKHLLENNKMIGEFCHIEGDKDGSISLLIYVNFSGEKGEGSNT